MNVRCKECGHPAVYSHSDKRGDVHNCPVCQTDTVHPMDTRDQVHHDVLYGGSRGNKALSDDDYQNELEKLLAGEGGGIPGYDDARIADLVDRFDLR